MSFVAIDVETANADMSSICQIGLAKYEGSQLVDAWKTYVNPQSRFDPINVSIHGIDQSMVQSAPAFSQLDGELRSRLEGTLVVCHSHFDRVALRQAYGKASITAPSLTWLDSARVARRAWQQFAYKGYGLHNVCKHLGYEFAHHDALEDAKAAGHIILSAIEETGIDLDGWQKRVSQPINPSTSEPIRRDGNPEGSLHGHVMVFTGALQIPRREAADLADRLGITVAPGVNKKTTLLVVGDQDIQRLNGADKSSKHQKAESLIAAGASIQILQESDFLALVDMAED